ncbi:MAG TPA: segregation/condensation protein A [Sedimenticola thiotaurini]|uniref:Segregation and condensation protein A n=1 Tax=Sedimenticola thiotaurini TaxID=1543721 RepID=A0A831RMT8_9GAMM|nr:segregation/condensation protein A [Sedimenticola thiotaurini]
MPFAVVQGEPWSTLPKDLYIPPDALEVFLDAFEGPLDLLLYLIKRQNLDILNIPIAEITAQYMEYVELMKEMQLELAAEYLVMAAMLAEIKSRMLLPRREEEEGEEGDPRAELIRRLQEYERYKQAAEDLDALPRIGRDLFPVRIEVPDRVVEQRPPDVDLREVLLALKEVLHRADMFSHHHVELEALSVRERMSLVLDRLQDDRFIDFTELFSFDEGRLGVVVTFLAILELLKGSLIEMVQAEPFGPIHVKGVSS